MFRKQEENLIELISGDTTLTNQLLHTLSKEVTDLKESLKFTQKKVEDKITDFMERMNVVKKEINSVREDANPIQNKGEREGRDGGGRRRGRKQFSPCKFYKRKN